MTSNPKEKDMKLIQRYLAALGYIMLNEAAHQASKTSPLVGVATSVKVLNLSARASLWSGEP